MQDQATTSYQTEQTDFLLHEPVSYAGFWERFAAIVLDLLIITIPMLVLQMMFFPFGLVASLFVPWLYMALMESGESQATLGKRALGIKVTTLGNRRLSFGQATGRFFGRIISGMILYIGYLMMLWDDNRQTLHDKMAGAIVVRNKD